ncbi:MAG: mandelate racemase/muconate lactonizing enzyme family protein [Eubacteriales bacterium]|nr:mandelate racemase/muconate lactonizing enzyme family protein [Eubacteriales bacterium]
MKITGINTYVVDMYRCNYIFVEIETDEGITGCGESTLEYRENAVVAAAEYFGKYLTGKDPMDIELHNMHMERDTYWRYGPVLSSALSGIDMALWDLKGKSLGVPVYQLLGGRIRDGLPVYVNGWFAGAVTKEEFAEKASATVSKGFKALKWDPFGDAFLNLDRKQLLESISRVELIRRTVGPEIELLIECHGRFNLTSAVTIAKSLEPYGIGFLEEPLHPGRNDLLTRLRDRIDIPVAAGERCYSRFEACSLIESGAVDVIQPDVCHVGGITALKKVAAAAEMNYINISPHNPSGPGSNAASMHAAATCVNFTYLETMANDVPWREDLVSEGCFLKDGLLYPGDLPGLGITFKKENFSAHPYKPHELRHYNGLLTDIRSKGSKEWY